MNVRRSISLLGTILVIAGCSSTRNLGSWKAPDASDEKPGRIAVLVLVPEDQVRIGAEDEIVQQLRAGSALAGHNLGPEAALEGFDGALTIRLVPTFGSWVPGKFPDLYDDASRPYRRGAWPDLEPTTTVRVEADFYSTRVGRLLWVRRNRKQRHKGSPPPHRHVGREAIAQLRNDKMIP